MAPLIVASKISIRNGDRLFFTGDSWTMREGEHWAIIGPNGSGKSTFAKALAGKLSVVAGEIRVNFGDLSKHPYPISQQDYIQYLSFDSHRGLIQKEDQQSEFYSYVGREYQSEIVGTFVGDVNILRHLNISDLSEKILTQLSTGEMRKVLIAKALVQKPKLLILDEPFEGVDIESKKSLILFIDKIISQNTHIVLITHHLEELLPSITHVLCVHNGHFLEQGKKEKILKSKESFNSSYKSKESDSISSSPPSRIEAKAIIEMSKVTVKFGDKVILNNITWTMHSDENWLIIGPNGAGKSTLVKLIFGDHLQAFSNTIKVFGKLRGTGESVWDIKKRIGYISSDMHIEYREHITAFDAVLSGLFDTIGLYKKVNSEQSELAQKYFDLFQLNELKDKDFMSLSLGQQRLILIMRAIIKSPELLILDEPCQGLDQFNRQIVLQVIDKIAAEGTNLIYITHHQNEIIQSITHVMNIDKGSIKTISHTHTM